MQIPPVRGNSWVHWKGVKRDRSKEYGNAKS